jgi:hypothetical protein
MILLYVPFNIALAVLPWGFHRRPWACLTLMALGPVYALLGLLLMQSRSFFDPKSDLLFIWPAYPWKAVACVIVGFILWREARQGTTAKGSA